MSTAVPSFRQEIKSTLVLGLPMAGAQISQLVMTATDVAFVGRLHGDALAAMAVGQAAYGFFFAFGIGLIAAVNPLVSQAFGARKSLEEIGRPIALGCWFAVIYGVLSWLCLWNIDYLFNALEYKPGVIEQATGFTRALMLGLPFYYIFLSLKNYLDGVSRPRLAFKIALLGIVINAVAGYAFTFGNLGAPNLGVVGTGLSTSLVNLCMASTLFAIAWKHEFKQAFLHPRMSDVREFFSIGLPMAMTLSLEVGLFVTAALLMGKLGSDEAAAHQIVITCSGTTFMVPLGISFAGATRVGQAVGAGRFSRVRAAGLAAICVGVGCMVLSAIAFTLIPSTIISLFWQSSGDHDRVGAFAIDLLLIAGVFQLFDGLQVTSGGALRGMKDVRTPLALALMSYWLIGLSVAVYLAFYTPLRHRGIWIGLATGLGCAGASLFTRFLVLSRRLVDDPELQAKVLAEAASPPLHEG